MRIWAENMQFETEFHVLGIEVEISSGFNILFGAVQPDCLEVLRGDVQNLLERIDEAIAHNHANRGPNE